MTATDTDLAADPADAADRTPADRLLLTAFRRWVVGWRDCRIEEWVAVWTAFHDALPRDRAANAVRALEGLFSTIGLNARRTLHHHQPRCPCVGPDEERLLALIGAAGGADPRTAEALAGALVRPEALAETLSRAHALAEAIRPLRAAGTQSENGNRSGLLH
ncbi:MAG: hypothetical protein RID91_12020 [Azospirillaceae bacterium]